MRVTNPSTAFMCVEQTAPLKTFRFESASPTCFLAFRCLQNPRVGTKREGGVVGMGKGGVVGDADDGENNDEGGKEQ